MNDSSYDGKTSSATHGVESRVLNRKTERPRSTARNVNAQSSSKGIY